MWKLLTRLFKKQIVVNIEADTVPSAFGYPYADYDKLVNEMINFIKEENRYQSFQHFITSNKFKKYKLDVDVPRDALLVGFAFCTVLMLQRSLKMHEAAKNALDAFYPDRRKN
jgi:hypothetical protein